ncbi:hypothetical protein SAMN05444921_10169 [Streptomyces wuyuanensis]|uniref:Excreted virulence factor EspC, type VII ESX diderm n=1 Tax=Streptomyces wuyuanensis TaxID=1196353 RepID=A0A1G9MGF3_9ACTN|nr:hypothetical protein SAMN05444921_10169 [Streptomyces wuyuanensis]
MIDSDALRCRTYNATRIRDHWSRGVWRTVGFDEEWAELRAQAAERRSAAMRLNQLPESGPAPGPSGTPELASMPAEKSAAAGVIENELLTRTRKAGGHADEANGSAVGAFSGWATAAALRKVQTTWDGQVETLMGRLGKERDGLRNTVTTLTGVDTGRRDRINGIRTPSVFNGYE